MFKLQLKIGWLHKKKKIELRAYDNIGIVYYYLGDIAAASYYHNRMNKAQIEPFDSPYRKAFIYSEKKLLQHFELERRGLAAYRHMSNRPKPIVADDKEAKLDALAQEIELCTLGDETPRAILDDPWKLEGIKDLPSPRTRSVYKAELYPMTEREVKINSRPTSSLVGYRTLPSKVSYILNMK